MHNPETTIKLPVPTYTPRWYPHHACHRQHRHHAIITTTDKNATYVEILAKSSRAQVSGLSTNDDSAGVTDLAVVLILHWLLLLQSIDWCSKCCAATDILHTRAPSWSKACPLSSLASLPTRVAFGIAERPSQSRHAWGCSLLHAYSNAHVISAHAPLQMINRTLT